MRKAKVYLVGAGPGKPDLITVRGLNILKEADVVIYDYLVDKRLLDQAKKGAELICCDQLGPSTSLRANGEHSRTIGKKRYSDGFLTRSTTPSTVGSLSVNPERIGASYSDESNGLKAQDKISDLMVRKAKGGKRVIRLKNGDPSIFSRCSQELNALVKEKIEFEVIPGVTAASAASSYLGVPLTDRRLSSSVVLVTGHEDPKKDKSLIDWKKISSCPTIVLYMAIENISKIVSRLLEAGKSSNTSVVAVSRAGDINQKMVRGRLRNIAEKVKRESITAPAIFIIGRVAELEKEFNWLKRNKRILFTGLSKERFFTKGTYFHFPLIKIEPMEDYEEFDNYLKNIKRFDWIVFISRYGVEYFFKRLNNLGFDSRNLSEIKIAAIGSSTKNRLLDFGVITNLVPKQENRRGLIDEFKKIVLKDKKIFLPRSSLSDKGLGREFKELGAKVTSSFAYRNVMPKDLPDLDLNNFSEIIFTSPSTVRNFKKRYEGLPKNVKIRCIGDVTLKEARKCRLLD